AAPDVRRDDRPHREAGIAEPGHPVAEHAETQEDVVDDPVVRLVEPFPDERHDHARHDPRQERHGPHEGAAAEGLVEQERGGEAAEELQRDGPEDPDERVPEREPEGRVTQQGAVVPEPDEAVLLGLEEDVVVEAHVHGLEDGEHDGPAQADRDRDEVEVTGQGPGHQAMFFASTSANFSRNSRAVSLPTSACWKSGTPSESSLPPHPAWARYGLTIENGKDLMKPAQDGSLANSGRSARVLRAGRRPRASQYSKFGAPSMSH